MRKSPFRRRRFAQSAECKDGLLSETKGISIEEIVIYAEKT